MLAKGEHLATFASAVLGGALGAVVGALWLLGRGADGARLTAPVVLRHCPRILMAEVGFGISLRALHTPPSVAGPVWHGHIGWAFTGAGLFEARATTFLAEGLALGQHLIFVTDDPEPRRWPPDLLRRGELQVLSTAEVYGARLVVDPSRQLSAFSGALSTALAQGYSGLRVVADNTSLVLTPRRLEAWARWEAVADRFMAERPVTGLCSFDGLRLGPRALDRLMSMHTRRLGSS